MSQAFGLLTKITKKKKSSSSRQPNLVIRVSFNACLRPPEQPNEPLRPEANTLDIVFPQTRTPLQRVFQHMFYAPPGDMAVNSTKFHIRSKYRIHQHGTFVDDELKPSSTGILCVAQSDSLRTVRTWTQSPTHSNDACPTKSWAIRLHSFLSGSGSLAAWRSCVFPGHANPDGCRATRNPSVRVSNGTVSPAAQRTILFGSARLLQICPDFELWPHSQHHLDSVDRDQLPRSDLIAHAPTQDTDKSSASHLCTFKGNGRVDARLALATLATSEQEGPAFVRPGVATFTY